MIKSEQLKMYELGAKLDELLYDEDFIEFMQVNYSQGRVLDIIKELENIYDLVETFADSLDDTSV